MMREYNKLSNFNILLEFPGARGASWIAYKSIRQQQQQEHNNKPELTGYV
jgi:hypothetical protein